MFEKLFFFNKYYFSNSNEYRILEKEKYYLIIKLGVYS
jgi:hypothetical protein